MRSEGQGEKQNEYYYQDQQNMHNLQNMKYIDPCFQDLPKTHGYDLQNYGDNTLIRGDYRKFPNQEKFVQSQTPSASMLPQIWNPRHMLGFEEFKNLNQNLDFNDLAINLNDEISVPEPDDVSQASPESTPIANQASKPAVAKFENVASPSYETQNNVLPMKSFEKQAPTAPHRFTAEELVPQNMVRKAKKVLVPEDAKDEKYWARRLKNNAAAKRSREARHQKENQIRLRALHLEKENVDLRTELLDARQELSQLRDLIRKRGLAITGSTGNSPNPAPMQNNTQAPPGHTY